MGNLLTLLLGVGGGGGLVYVFLKGALSQMSAWKNVVEAQEHRLANLVHENAAQSKIIEEQRAVIDTAYVHLEACRKENELVNNRMSQMSLEMLDLKTAIHHLEEKLKGKEKLD